MESIKEIHYDSDNAAVYETRELTGWWSNNGMFCGENEQLARWKGCTTVNCTKCGKPTQYKVASLCLECEKKRNVERYNKLPSEDWDGEPLYTFDDEKFFFDYEDVIEYCIECDCRPEDLLLVSTERVPFERIDEDYWEESLSTDDDRLELPENIRKKLDELNNEIDKTPGVLYSPTNVRVIFEYDKKDLEQ